MKIEWLILADAAQVVGEKLYLLGGGWDRLTANSDFPLDYSISIALSVKVPWIETNQRHDIELEVTDQDHTKVLAKLDAGLEVGRPPGLPAGTEQRAQLAATFPIRIEAPGVYEINARIKDSDVPAERVTLTVVQSPLFALRTKAGGT